MRMRGIRSASTDMDGLPKWILLSVSLLFTVLGTSKYSAQRTRTNACFDVQRKVTRTDLVPLYTDASKAAAIMSRNRS